MNITKTLNYFLLFTSLFSILSSCDSKPKKPKETPLVVREDSLTEVSRAREILENITPKVGEGLELSLWASDSLAPDPIAMQMDKYGRVYLTRTNRQKNSEFDIRGHRDWMTASIALESPEDRRAFLRETFAPEKSEENEWLKDLNGDGSHDWKDLTVEKEEVWMLEDSNNNGIADKATRILEDFNEEITDVAGALLVRDEDVFVGVGPDMWRLTDTNDDLVLDEKTSIAHGFAVHIGFGGHGMSGAVEGPDGKIYWGIGDIGANLTTVEGEKHKYPNQGVIVRSNPDGTDFEVFARGLRNTHEFVFDAYGNIISADNDGDHAGESERLVHIVEGSDAGWRANWQYGKYTDEKNNGYNVWMDEKLYVPRWEGQAAYIIPPIQNFHNGPTGMLYNPGTALGKKWLDRFFLVEFVGNPDRSHIWSFDLKPKGASFELNSDQSILSGVLPTGIQFGPDGALYVADWINGWDTKNYGRVWKLDVSDGQNDLEQERRETQRLMTLDYKGQSTETLVDLLSYSDMRIRKRAQFQLVKNGSSGYKAFQDVIKNGKDQFARIHAIWGIGQLAADDLDRAKVLVDLLSDSDPEIIAQALKVLGDVKYTDAASNYIPLLGHENARVKFFAAQALGRTKHEAAVQPLLDMIAKNNDEDLYLRHAGVLALTRIGKTEPIVALADNEDRSLRIAAVLVLRRLENPEVKRFLNDADEYIVTEAARAINDDWSIEEALPELAAVLTSDRFTSEPLLRRAINAALRVGGDKELENLIAFAKRQDISNALRGEALATIGTWAEPSVLDRVDGRYRGEVKRDPNVVREKFEKDIPEFLEDQNPEILIGISKTLANLKIDSHNPSLFAIMKSNKSPRVRSEILKALGQLDFDRIEAAMQLGMKDKEEQVRTTAVGLISKLEISKENLPGVVTPIFRNGSVREQQRLLGVLGELPLEKSADVLEGLVAQAKAKKLDERIILDLIEAVETTESEPLIAQLDGLKGGGNSVEAFKETLVGGNRRAGYRVFNNNPTAQCTRCHAIGGAGGTVGPQLENIGNILTREQLLESLIEPSKRLAPGYGSVVLTLKDGQKVNGILEEENEHELVLRTNDAEPLEIPISRIEKRENMPSAMPAMGKLISKRELRDLIEFLSSLKKGPNS
ncbi:HEAT repeat domain-containing protein [Pseudozobellia thermophila]|uniref:Putative membrane-bound dehydrogenase domain-containing protein n=1 Tax=Pseudozobellia thermophila TaxID=192903 RepID=A0A1M6MKW6_9FLAO|nr:HEAT repeat domain-containing protein [Pseudozobellia thermophila]SHJ84118.1 putative membrane-bound dehydrogenase domain-containing protein [Pseudozobellia thermophila]